MGVLQHLEPPFGVSPACRAPIGAIPPFGGGDVAVRAGEAPTSTRFLLSPLPRQVRRQHKLEGADPEADPFEYPINTVQVFRCAPFLGSPLVGVALGLMTINVRTSPVGTIERSWQFPENFSASGSGSRLRVQDR